MRALRRLVQFIFLAGTVALLVRGMNGATPNTCETYCPFAGLVALYPLLRYQTYTCAMNEFHVALFVSLVGLTVLSKKSFCSWICPLGAVQEWFWRLSRKLFGRTITLPRPLDRPLIALRYLVLVAVLGMTWTVWQGDLGFRAYDPFYIIFTGFQGHELLGFSLFIGIGVLIVALLVPMFWCRYLCPLGAAIDPLSRLGFLRLRRVLSACTDCGKCDEACPERIPVSQLDDVTARDCTNCFECTGACPEPGALELTLLGK